MVHSIHFMEWGRLKPPTSMVFWKPRFWMVLGQGISTIPPRISPEPLKAARFNASCRRAAAEVLEEAVADDLLANMQVPGS